MRSIRNIIVGILVGVFAIMIVVSVATHGFTPQTVRAIKSNLPIVVIRMDTTTPVNVDEMSAYTVPSWMEVIGNIGGENHFTLPYNSSLVTERYKIGMHLRGQSSRNNPKKPFAVKMYDKKSDVLTKKEYSLFGMPKQDKYVLYSACADPALIRNQVAFELYRDMGHYAPRMEFIELFIVSTNTSDIYYPQHYHGVYLMSERIHRGKDWVDIKKMDAGDETGKKLTGGYIVKVDKESFDDGHVDENSVFDTQYAKYTITEPSDAVLTATKMNYLKQYIENVEWAITNADTHTSPSGQHYSELIDEMSFADMFIIQELSKNVDAYRLSSYFYKDRNAKLTAGPAWDLDRTFGNELFNLDTTSGWIYNDRSVADLNAIPDYWVSLLSDGNFTAKLKTRWTELRQGPLASDKVLTRIEEHGKTLQAQGAAERDYNRWGPWYFPFEFWVLENYNSHQVSVMKKWTKKRLEWMDKAISNFP